MVTIFAQETQDAALVRLGSFLKNSGYRYTTVTPATHCLVNSREGNAWAADLAGIFGWSRPFRASLISPELMDLMLQAKVVTACDKGWRSVLRVSSINGSLFFHSAYPTDQADAVFFGPDTYRFVTAINQHVNSRSTRVRRAVDIGCGAGPGAIAIARAQPQTDVLAVDINEYALRLTRVNATLAATANVQASYSNILSATQGMFDLIVANPPYLVDPACRAYRHGGGELGAQLSLDIIQSALKRLSADGTLLLYTGAAIVKGIDRFRIAVEQLLQHAGVQWDYREVDPDVFGEELANPGYANTDRIAAVVLTASRPG